METDLFKQLQMWSSQTPDEIREMTMAGAIAMKPAPIRVKSIIRPIKPTTYDELK